MKLSPADVLKYFEHQPNKKWSLRELIQLLQLKGDARKGLKKIVKDLAAAGQIHKVAKNIYKKELLDSENLRIKRPKHRNEVSGRLQMRYEGYGFVLQPESADIFVAAPNIRDALPDDEVLVEVYENKRNGKKEGIILEVLKRGRQEWMGSIARVGSDYYAINREFKNEYSIHVSNFRESGAKEGDVVSCRITHFPTDQYSSLSGEISHVLGPEGAEATEVRLVLAKHKIPETFPEGVIEEAKKLPTFVYDAATRRVDLRDKPFITIDGADARDFDDAVLVEKIQDRFHLYVSIADVSHYVKKDANLDKEACSRGTSTYFPRFCVPMLPEELSNDLCSLREKVDRPTLTCELIYNLKGQLLDTLYYASVIKSVKRCVYEDIAKILDGKSVKGYQDIPDLTPALELFNFLLKQRKTRGALDFDLPEAFFVFDKKGDLIEIKKRERLKAHLLIEEFMIAANQAVAFWFQQSGVPALYRVHESPDPLKIADLRKLMFNLGVKAPFGDEPTPLELSEVLSQIQNHPSSEVINQNLLRSLRVAVYAPESSGHYGLALKYYCHFTSPIRRYPDLVVHRTFQALLNQSQDGTVKLNVNGYKKLSKRSSNASGAYSFKQLSYIGLQNSASERKSMEAEREMQNLLLCLFIKKFEGDEFLGTIRRIAKFGIFVELPPHFAEGLVGVDDLGLENCRYDEKHMTFVGRLNGRRELLKLGDTLPVVIRHVDVSRRQIQLERAGIQKRRPGSFRERSRRRR